MQAVRVDLIVSRTSGPDVLDVGCTGGAAVPDNEHWLHGRLVRCFPSVCGIDINVDELKKMRGLGYSDVLEADAQAFQLGRAFDTIVAGEVIEHLENPASFLRCARQHLKPGGRIVLTTPYAFALHSMLYAVAKYPHTCSNAGHTLWLCPETLRELARRCGLRILELTLIEDYLPGSGSMKYAIFEFAVQRLRWLIPLRLRGNRILAVLGSA